MTDNSTAQQANDIYEQLRAERLDWIMWGTPMPLCGWLVNWGQDTQEQVDYSVNRAERRRRKRMSQRSKKPDQL